MRTKTISLAASLLAMLAVPATLLAAPTSFAIDAGHSQALFRVTHFGVGAFWGQINDPTGTVTVDGDNLSVDVTVEAAKIDTNNAKRDEHLRGADFFNAEQFPNLTFKSKSSKKISDSAYEVTGDLTIKGVTKSVTITMNKIGEGPDPFGGYRIGFETELTINRLDFGVDYNPKALGTDVKLIIALEAIRK
jgi:polyisoprenoid-binding protein YceI